MAWRHVLQVPRTRLVKEFAGAAKEPPLPPNGWEPWLRKHRADGELPPLPAEQHFKTCRHRLRPGKGRGRCDCLFLPVDTFLSNQERRAKDGLAAECRQCNADSLTRRNEARNKAAPGKAKAAALMAGHLRVQGAE